MFLNLVKSFESAHIIVFIRGEGGGVRYKIFRDKIFRVQGFQLYSKGFHNFN